MPGPAPLACNESPAAWKLYLPEANPYSTIACNQDRRMAYLGIKHRDVNPFLSDIFPFKILLDYLQCCPTPQQERVFIAAAV